MQVKTGGASRFAQVLKTEVFPFIHVGAKQETGSLQGTPWAFCSVNKPAFIFGACLAVIPFWGEQCLQQQERLFLKRQPYLTGTRFITVGVQEQLVGMILLMQQSPASVLEHRYNRLAVGGRILPNETHTSAFLTVYNQGLRFVYRK